MSLPDILDYFIDCINQGHPDNIASFAKTLKTDIVMEEITKDAAKSLGLEDDGAQMSPILAKSVKKKFMWKRLLEK